MGNERRIKATETLLQEMGLSGSEGKEEIFLAKQGFKGGGVQGGGGGGGGGVKGVWFQGISGSFFFSGRQLKEEVKKILESEY